ncbi:uncharacterized protein LOC111087280 [Limulus polyphemus]|uniref:Uncharacterized protein LOC111087280 n=1 Tax=Limulus polyphemus TaxID=6850 RepID=A0ABM1SZN4_LIMPO|nr:uncharacterized protein LOC111087280 [Limulus polyphemus]
MTTSLVTIILVFTLLVSSIPVNFSFHDTAFRPDDVENKTTSDKKLTCLILGQYSRFCENQGGDSEPNNIREESMEGKIFSPCRGLACKLKRQMKIPEMKQFVDFNKRQNRLAEDGSAFYSGW